MRYVRGRDGTGGRLAAWRAAALCLLTLTAASHASGQAVATGKSAGGDAVAQAAEIASASVRASPAGSELELRRADGATLRIELSGGEARIEGRAIGAYLPDGALESSWRDLLGEATRADGPALEAALRGWRPGADEAEAETAERLREAIVTFQTVPPPAPETRQPERRGVAIEPGGLSFGELSDRLGRLEASLSPIGPQAEAAAEDLVLVVHDDLELGPERVVPGNLALLEGRLDLAGTVEGHVLVLDGELRLHPGARVRGDVLQAGGEVRDLGGRVSGERVEVRRLGPREVAPAAPAPPAVREVHRPGPIESLGRNVARTTGDLVGLVGFYLVAAVVGVLLVYFARRRLEVVADTARGNFVRSFGAGIAGQILFFPVLLVLAVAVVTILVIPFYLLGVALALVAGYLAAAHALGETVALQRYQWFERLQLRRSNSYYYTLSGLAFLLAPFALAAALQLFGGLLGFVRGVTLFVGFVGTWVAVTTGVGAVLLSRGGSRSDYAYPATPAGGDLGSDEAPVEAAGA